MELKELSYDSRLEEQFISTPGHPLLPALFSFLHPSVSVEWLNMLLSKPLNEK